MKILRVFMAGLVIALATGIGGCCGGGGSDVKTENKNITTTLGTELQDLKDAYDRGIISEKEYKEAKEKILKQRTKSE